MNSKPAYEPLTMAQVTSAPLSSLTHVSTFSGGGGTCLGFRLAGFKTLWANDIEAHARACYAANLDSPIDGTDIREVTAEMILSATGLKAGELDVFEGSPPCTAFSTAGKRAKGWGQRKEHAGHIQSNIEDLFFEWLRILDGLRPRAFVAENVAGLVKGVAKGYFKDIIRRMKALGYRTEARLLDAQWLGVPQSRQRVIFIGMREDLGVSPQWPTPWRYQYSVRDALPWVTAAALDTGGQYAGRAEFVNEPCPAIIGASQPGRNSGHYKVLGLPPSRTPGSYGVKEVNPNDPCPCITIGSPGNDVPMVQHGARPKMFSSSSSSPVIMAGRVTNIDFGATRRKFTIDELKRICSFPDDYVMTGSYAQQWARLGNSVPPLMAKAIADSVREALTAGAAVAVT